MQHQAYQTQKIFFALGTVCTLTVSGSSSYRAAQKAKTRIMEIHRAMNAYAPDSEVSAVNAAAGKSYVPVGSDVLRLIEESVAFSMITDGSYDVTTRPISSLWKTAVKTQMLPSQSAVSAAASLSGWRDILIDSDRSAVMLRRAGQQLDLGAIAKGYAADEVRRILKEEGVADALVNLGGTVVNLGSTRRIGVQNPFESTGTPFSFVDIEEKAVVSSGIYEQGFVRDGVAYHHIIDPVTGYPSTSPIAGVTLIGDSAATLDALATAACVMPVEQAIRLLNRFNAEAIFVTKSGEVFTTKGVRCQMLKKERNRVA